MKTLFFDMDGVLIKEERYWKVTRALTLDLLGKELPFEFIQRCKNTGLNSNWRIAHAFLGENGIEMTLEKVAELAWKKLEELKPGNETQIPEESMRTALSDLKKEFELYVVTSRPKDEADEAVNGTVLNEFFPVERVYGRPADVEQFTNTGGKKAVIASILHKIECSEGSYIGDAVCDVRTAKDLGFRPIGVYGALKNREALEQEGADLLVETVAELPRCLHH